MCSKRTVKAKRGGLCLEAISHFMNGRGSVAVDFWLLGRASTRKRIRSGVSVVAAVSAPSPFAGDTPASTEDDQRLFNKARWLLTKGLGQAPGHRAKKELRPTKRFHRSVVAPVAYF
jgi:hypothetical protein